MEYIVLVHLQSVLCIICKLCMIDLLWLIAIECQVLQNNLKFGLNAPNHHLFVSQCIPQAPLEIN